MVGLSRVKPDQTLTRSHALSSSRTVESSGSSPFPRSKARSRRRTRREIFLLEKHHAPTLGDRKPAADGQPEREADGLLDGPPTLSQLFLAPEPPAAVVRQDAIHERDGVRVLLSEEVASAEHEQRPNLRDDLVGQAPNLRPFPTSAGPQRRRGGMGGEHADIRIQHLGEARAGHCRSRAST